MRRAAVRLAEAIAILALGFALTEAALRVLDFPRREYPMSRIANTKGSDVRAGTLSLLAFPSDPRGYFETDLRDPATRRRYENLAMRNIDKVIDKQPFVLEARFNSKVYRGPEFPPPRPGVPRVAVIGDSFTEGWGVRWEHVFHHHLASLLTRRTGREWQILNMARADADFPRLWFLFRRALLEEPDYVVYLMTLNDPARNDRLQARRSRHNLIMVREGPDTLEEDAELHPLRLVQWFRGQRESRRLNEERVRWYHDLYGRENRLKWRETKGYIRDMNAWSRAHGARFLLATWPLLYRLDGDYPFESIHRNIREHAERRDIAFHDMLSDFRGRDASRLWVHPVDHHPNEIAHRIAAESLAPALLALAAR